MMSKFVVKIGKNCVACGVCENIYPRGAIKVKNGIRSVVDTDICIGCGICANECPAGIIEKIVRDKNE